MFPSTETSLPRILLLTSLILATLFIAASTAPLPSILATPHVQKTREAENYRKIPLTFEANQGQADQSVNFLARGSGYGVYLTGEEAALMLCTPIYGSRAEFSQQCEAHRETRWVRCGAHATGGSKQHRGTDGRGTVARQGQLFCRQ